MNPAAFPVLVDAANPNPSGPIFLILGLIYAITTSPEKKQTSIAAVIGFASGIFLGAALEGIFSLNSTGTISAAFGTLFSVLFAVYHSRKAKTRAKVAAAAAADVKSKSQGA